MERVFDCESLREGDHRLIKPRREDVNRSDGIALAAVGSLLVPAPHGGVAFYLSAGDLVGYGIRHGGYQPEMIRPELWHGFKIDLAKSRVADDAGRQFDGVTIFPVVSAPDAPSLIAGKSLRDVFHRFVRLDPIVAARGDDAVAVLPGWGAVLRGLSADGFTFWPVRYEDWDFLRRPDPVRWAGAEFRDRYRSLINLFRSGRIVVTGLARNGANVQIPAACWDDALARVDFNSCLLFFNPFVVSDAVNSLTANLPDQVANLPFYTPPPVAVPPSKSSDARSAELWLREQAEASSGAKPGVSDKMYQRVKKELLPDLSRRAFDRAWNSVAKDYPQLSARGAPKKKR
ncbi:hypothetical protein [Bradyrhizobium sp. Ash2021]|uniref:hypothetical protein n=1 Tax=Bradyrhizobium sp. Ash2021 TaxID=2954771 RepID=UPI0028162B5F|nr:hypothetical protein [Bradyrhizobium sp. Ash2021]WMT73936.1 hypothetical protein NL528_39495 [Bradyrhizobium sp. Ash2021]